MSDMIKLSRPQLQRLLSRFGEELHKRGGTIPDGDLEQVATHLLDEMSPGCHVTGSEPQPMLNSNVVIKI